MEIILNNRKEVFDQDPMTITEIMQKMNFTFPRLVIKLNGQLIKKDQFATTAVTEADQLDIIHLISGG